MKTVVEVSREAAREALPLRPEFRLASSESSQGRTHLGRLRLRIVIPPHAPCRRNRPPCRAASGFTIIELLIVLAVLMTITAIAVPNLISSIEQARIARAVGDIRAIEDEVTVYNAMNGKFPDSLADIGRDTTIDPWGEPYFYLNHSTMKGNGASRKDRFLVPLNGDYDLYSAGKDMRSVPPITAKASQDDIIRAGNGSYVGPASLY